MAYVNIKNCDFETLKSKVSCFLNLGNKQYQSKTAISFSISFGIMGYTSLTTIALLALRFTGAFAQDVRFLPDRSHLAAS